MVHNGKNTNGIAFTMLNRQAWTFNVRACSGDGLMNDHFLTDLETAGAQALLPRSATREERAALVLHLKALRAQGHALAIDEVFEHNAESGEIRIQHYLSCTHPNCKRTVL